MQKVGTQGKHIVDRGTATGTARRMSLDIVTSTNDCVDLAGGSKKCGICYVEISKYTCPRCNLPYCSVACFKHSKHSGCSESFYKDWFMEELRHKKASDAEKGRILNMLKHLEETEEECDAPSLEERLEGLDLHTIGEEDLWNKLTKEEQDDFVNSLRDGRCEMKTWTPWWMRHDMRLITEIGISEDETSGTCQTSPSIPKSGMTTSPTPGPFLEVAPLSVLLRGKQPSPLIRNNLISTLYPYAFFCRLYNGSIQDFAEEFAPTVIESCPFLQRGETQHHCKAALSVAIEGCNEHSTDRLLLVEIILDVYHILIGQSVDETQAYVAASLSELHSMCKSYKQLLKNQLRCDRPDAKNVFQAMKKIEFLLSWANSHLEDLITLAHEVMSEYKRRKFLLTEQNLAEENVSRIRANAKSRKNGPLVEEIK